MDIEEEKFETPKKMLREEGSHLTLIEKCRSYLQKKNGDSVSDIARGLNRSWNVTDKFLKRAESNKSTDNRDENKGRYKKGITILTERHKRLIEEYLEEDPQSSSMAIWQKLSRVVTLMRISYDVVNNYIKTLGSWVKPRMKSEISINNHGKRLQYCQENINTIIGEEVLYTNESTFMLNRNTIKVFKFKDEDHPTKEQLNPNSTQVIWTGISLRGKTQIYFLEGWVDSVKYVDMLKEARREILELFPGDFYFLQDNAGAHKHEDTLRYLRGWITPHIKNHPPQSPDLNPIELVWSRLKNLVEKKRPQTKTQLRNAIIES
jgi:hypothetical protein